MGDDTAVVAAAVRAFWSARASQSERQRARGTGDTGARSAVTGGRQMDGFVDAVRRILIGAGCPESSIFSSRGALEIPGWFRAEKQWDLLVVHRSVFVAAFEFKSQVGPSFGNNFNNRTEEALGSATDLWAAYREGAFSPSPKPWLGYLMLLEDCEASARPVGVSEPHFAVFPEYSAASYQARYSQLVKKLVRDRLYDSACLLLSTRSEGVRGQYREPDPEIAFGPCMRGLLERVRAAIQER